MAATPAATPGATGTPAASGSPVAAGDLGDYANAEGQTGFEEVKALKPPASSPDAIAKGKEVYAGAGNCVSCHGADGKGDGPAGTALDPPPRNMHATADYKYGTNELAIFRTVKYGIDGTGMAPLEGVLTDEQIWQVTAYVKSIQGS
jgi:mono/diheme cytochrome c family protein